MKNLWISVRITLAMCVVLTVGYVLLLRLTSAVVSPNDGEAALVELDGKVVGAANVGQAFTDSVYFWGRPSAVEYNGGRFWRKQQGHEQSGVPFGGGKPYRIVHGGSSVFIEGGRSL